MTEAFVRTCNKCNARFLKEEGCNRMKCACGNLQCYICSADVVDYSHFSQVNENGKICPLHGDAEQILSEEVVAAQENTIQALLETRPELRYEDLRIDTDPTTSTFGVPNPGVPRRVTPLLFLQYATAPMQYEAPQNQEFTCPDRRQVYGCQECPKSFGSAASLFQHQKARHDRRNTAQNKTIKCPGCSKRFATPSSLFQHKRDKHGSGAPTLKRNRSSGPQKTRLRRKGGMKI